MSRKGRKGSITSGQHLLNFTFPIIPSPALPSKKFESREIPKHVFLRQSYRFFVFHERLLYAAPDDEIAWDNIAGVIATIDHYPRCPICLESPPIAPHVSTCGHIFCLPCFIHLASFGYPIVCPVCSYICGELCKPIIFQLHEIPTLDSPFTLVATCPGQNLQRSSKNDEYDRFSLIQVPSKPMMQSILDKHLSELISLGEDTYTQLAIEHVRFSSTFTLANLSHEPAGFVNDQPMLREFFQCSNGSFVFLDPLNHHCLKCEFGSALPCRVTGTVREILPLVQSAETRRKFSFLRHLPLGTSLKLVYLDLSEFLSVDTLHRYNYKLSERECLRLMRFEDDCILEQKKMEQLDLYKCQNFDHREEFEISDFPDFEAVPLIDPHGITVHSSSSNPCSLIEQEAASFANVTRLGYSSRSGLWDDLSSSSAPTTKKRFPKAKKGKKSTRVTILSTSSVGRRPKN